MEGVRIKPTNPIKTVSIRPEQFLKENKVQQNGVMILDQKGATNSIGLLNYLLVLEPEDYGNVLENLRNHKGSLSLVAGLVMEELGFPKESKEYKAAKESSDIVEKEKSEAAYHSPDHTRDVALSVMRFARLETPPLEKKEMGILFLAGLGHDAKHPGGSNKFKEEFEKQSTTTIEAATKKLEEEDKRLIDKLILSTDFKENVPTTRKNYIEAMNAFEKRGSKVDKELQMKALLSDADLASSVAVSKKLTVRNSERLA